jgi:hypothetical protein
MIDDDIPGPGLMINHVWHCCLLLERGGEQILQLVH